MIFNGGFETIGILQRFLKQWYLIEVVKNFSRGLKKPRGTVFPMMV